MTKKKTKTKMDLRMETVDGRQREEREHWRERREKGTEGVERERDVEKKKMEKMEEEEEPWAWYISQGYNEDILSSQ